MSALARRLVVVGIALATFLAWASWGPSPAVAHPLGNFSISHYTAIRLTEDAVELHYVVDLAEIPTFQEIQQVGLTPDANHPSAATYATRTGNALRDGLGLEVDGRPLALRAIGSEIIFPPGAGGLPTLKLGVRYRATLSPTRDDRPSVLRYRDTNFPDRAGWKEIVATVDDGVRLVESSVPAADRSRELTDYPTDLLASPPQDLEATVVFSRVPRAPVRAAAEPAPPSAPDAERPASPPVAKAGLVPNRQPTPRNAFTELLMGASSPTGPRMLLLALAVAAGLGAFHALEPGHGKTVVAAYLVGARGTARHAVILGLVVTAAHTAGVYLLGAVTLYASHYIVPERLFPWLGLLSGLTIAGLGAYLLSQRYIRTRERFHHHGDDHHHAHGHHHGHDHGHPGPHTHGGHVHHHATGEVSLRELAALGVSGGIVPCPAALVILLSALSLGRLGFGLVLIVAFSLGLAAVLVGIGLLMVYARRLMAHLHGDGPVVTRWLPLTSAATMVVLGVALTVQALAGAGFPFRLS
jgi:ABC-type nickel/cobalt efflux system permease component RcnA